MVKIIHVTPAQVLAAQTLLRRQATNRETLRKIANAQPSETNMDYETEKSALAWAILNEPKRVREQLELLDTEELDTLIDGVDVLGAIADDEAIKRAEKRR